MPVILFGGGLPNPSAVAGLTGWWDAETEVYSDAGTTPAVDTNTVYRWGNRVDTNYVEQPTAGNRPTYRTGIVSGRAVIRFGGVTDDDFLDSNVALSTFMAVGAKTIFTVHYHSANANDQLIGDTAGKIGFSLATTGSDLVAGNDDGVVDQAVNTAQATATWTIGTYWHDGVNLRCGVNDTRTASMTSVASGNTSSLAGTMRFGISVGGASPLDGDIASVVIYNAALSESDRQIVERYLANYYNITLPY